MFICKICNHSCSRGSGHIKAKHNISTMEYLKQYENLDVINLYSQGFSAQQIADKIKDKNIGISPIKKDVLVYLRNNNIDIRNTSEATKCWIDKTGGVWNKGLTKENHPSIMKYAESRMGKNNPMFKMNEDKRKQHNDKLQNNRKLWISNGNVPKHIKTSKMEKQISFILETMSIKHRKQYRLSTYIYDFLLEEEKLIIEYNGDYWHCNPEIYSENYIHPHNNKTAEEIRQYDYNKRVCAEDNGFSVLTLWESELKYLTTEQIKEFLREAIKSKSNNQTS
jgi:very-short-patch-repair endonuclease